MEAGSAAGAVGGTGAEDGAGAVGEAVLAEQAGTAAVEDADAEAAAAAAAAGLAGGPERPAVDPDPGSAERCPEPGLHRSRSTAGPVMGSGEWRWQDTV